MIWHRRAARRQRYREILSAMSRHGLGAFVNEAGLGRALPFHRGLFGHERRATPYTTPEHVRLAMEELGTTAIKLGQILSTRPDFVAPEYIYEFEKLRDRVAPAPTEAIIETIERELGDDVARLFREFDRVPLAAASIGQVHAAVLHDGSRVVVKVQKPGMARTVAEDLAILAELARRVTAGPLAEHYDVEAIVDDFSWTLRAELDYVREGRNADRLRGILAPYSNIVIPEVCWEVTTGKVLVMQRVDGVRIDDKLAWPPGTDARLLTHTAAEALLTEVFEAGFFHADPHPGNFLVLSDRRLAILDFGMTGYLDEEVKYQLMMLLDACVRQDAADATWALELLGAVRTASSRMAVRRDLQHLLDTYYGVPLQDVYISALLRDLLGIVRRNHLRLPTELALVLKTTVMSEALWRQVDPQFNFAVVAEPFASRMRSPRYAFRELRRRIGAARRQSAVAVSALPGQLGRVASRLDRGEFEVALRHRDLDEYLDRVGAMVGRLATAVLASSFVVGLAILGAASEPPGWSLLAPVGFAIGSFITVGLLLRLLVLGGRRRGH